MDLHRLARDRNRVDHTIWPIDPYRTASRELTLELEQQATALC
jgi:hypothetical protein